MFRIGNQTSCHSQNILDPFEFAVHYNFGCFEWFFDKNENGNGLDISRIDTSFQNSIKHRALKADLSLSVHVPCDLSVYTSEGMRILNEILQFTFYIRARVLVLHFDSSKGTRAFATKMRAIANNLFTTDIILTIENTPYNGPMEFNQFFATLSARSKKKIGMAFDIGHANLYPDFRNNFLGYLNALAPHVPIYHLHFHENSGGTDSHNCIFSTHSKFNDLGIRTLIKTLVERNSTGNIILEQWPQPRSQLLDARDRLQKIIDQERIRKV
ncbi:MAG: TIM barrel protein [bacterium]